MTIAADDSNNTSEYRDGAVLFGALAEAKPGVPPAPRQKEP